MRALEDRELWEKAASGSDEAFATLFERHAAAVYNYCFRRRGDWAAAEDLTSATFLEAWRRRDELKLSGDSIRPWLLGVATNLLRNDIRSRRRRGLALQRLARFDDRPEDALADDVAGRIDDQRRMAHLLAQLTRLSSEHQDVVALVLWSGLSYEDASIALGVPVGTVKSRLSRARRELSELATVSPRDEGPVLSRPCLAGCNEVEA